MIYRNKLNYDDIGGDKRDRTADLLRARQALSQLSYIPNFITFLLASLICQLTKVSLSGGSEWTWTTDLTLIRGAL